MEGKKTYGRRRGRPPSEVPSDLVHVHVWLKAIHRDAIREHAARLGISDSELVRQLVDALIRGDLTIRGITSP